jgi:hypothetical protein
MKQPADDVQEARGKEFYWASEEGKQATERLNSLLRQMDKTAPEGSVRTAVPLGTDENGEVFGIIAWRRP